MKVIKRSFKYIKKYPFSFIFLVLCSLSNTILSIGLPYLSGNFLDKLIQIKEMKIIYIYAGLYISIAILQILLQYISIITQSKISAYSSMKLNSDLITHLQRLPLSYFKNKDISYINQRVYSDSSTVIGFTLDTSIQLISNITSLLVTLILILKVNKLLFFYFIACAVIYFVQFKLVKKRLYIRTNDYKEEQSQFYSSLYEQLDKIKLIKTYNLFNLFKNKLEKSFLKLYTTIIKTQKTMFIFQGSQTLVSAISKVILMIIGGIQLLKGNLSIGMFSILLSYLGMILSNITYFVNIGKSYVSALVSYQRIESIFKEKVDNQGSERIEHIYNINVENLTFSHDNKPILKNFSCKLLRDNIYCIYGANGIGKTTFIDIILGFIDNYCGEIIINDRMDVKSLDIYIYRVFNIAITSQETLFYNDSVYKNLILGCEEGVDTQKLNELVKGFELFNGNKKRSLNYIINEKGDNLSGGEMQKIALIRTFLRNKEVLIFDEPTTFLDEVAKQYFIKKIQEYKKEKIILIITHDKELLNKCDILLDFNKKDSFYIKEEEVCK